MRAYKKHVEEKSRLGKKCQREKPQAESFLFWNLLKTTSEWPQSGPVTPLSSNKWFYSLPEIFLNQETDETNRVEPRVRKLAPCIADVHCRGLSF